MDRRTMLKTAAAMTAAPLVLIGSNAAPAVLPFTNAYEGTSSGTVASLELLNAQARLNAALAEEVEAKDALEWLADEWRHLWPLAPEELLEGTNGDVGYGRDAAERDIIGRFLYRDTSDLTTRLNAKQRRALPRACFTVMSASWAQEALNGWTRSTPKARTEKALVRARDHREKMIQRYKRAVTLANQYEAEIKKLREAAGVDQAHKRVQDAAAAVAQVCAEIDRLPAANTRDLLIKAEALKACWVFKGCEEHSGIFGQLARFVQTTIDLGRQAA